MKVGIVINPLHPSAGGSHTYVESVLAGLANSNTKHEIFLLTTSRISSPIVQNTRIKVVNLPQSNNILTQNKRVFVKRLSERLGIYKLLSSVRRMIQTITNPSDEYGIRESIPLENVIKDLDIDVIWFVEPNSCVTSVPFFVTVWDLAHRKQPYFPEIGHNIGWNTREKLYGTILPRAARIFCGTQTGKEEIIHFYRVNPENVVVNPLVVPQINTIPDKNTEYLDAHSLKPGFLFYPAQFWPHKNHINLLHALKLLKDKHGLSPHLVLTGSDKGNIHYVRSTISELELNNQVHLLGFVSSDELLVLYRNAALMVFPTFFGPDNIPPLEAFQLGCPVVASNISGAVDQLGDAVLYFDPANPAEMAQIISCVLRDGELREKLISKSKNLCSSRTPEIYVQKVMDALDDFEPIRKTWRNDHMPL